jgi:hypothetical protein
MLDRNDDRTINALVDEVLTALRENLAEHQEIVEEARKGYMEKCRKALVKAQNKLTDRLSRLEDGEILEMKAITFNLTPPQDHSKEFKTVIKMLELHKSAYESDHGNSETQATIPLKAADVQRFVLNDWSWMDTFLHSNAVYSEKARLLSSAV